MTTALSTRNLSVRFGDTLALNSIDLSITKQGTTALLGENGAGKTTLINCALGLCKPDSGSISVFSKPPGKPQTKALIGVMLQDSALPDLLTGKEHIELFRSYYRNPMSLSELIKRCDLKDFINVRYKHLSGGQQRRIQFALAILGRPKIIFLDEPTTGLDIDARKTVWSTIQELEEDGATIVLTTHYLEEADFLASNTVVMHRGEVVANGHTEEIRSLASGVLIRVKTELRREAIRALSSIQSVKYNSRDIEAISNDATDSLAKLIQLDPNIKILSVSRPTLEQAFVELTSSARAKQEEA